MCTRLQATQPCARAWLNSAEDLHPLHVNAPLNLLSRTFLSPAKHCAAAGMPCMAQSYLAAAGCCQSGLLLVLELLVLLHAGVGPLPRLLLGLGLSTSPDAQLVQAGPGGAELVCIGAAGTEAAVCGTGRLRLADWPGPGLGAVAGGGGLASSLVAARLHA